MNTFESRTMRCSRCWAVWFIRHLQIGHNLHTASAQPRSHATSQSTFTYTHTYFETTFTVKPKIRITTRSPNTGSVPALKNSAFQPINQRFFIQSRSFILRRLRDGIRCGISNVFLTYGIRYRNATLGIMRLINYKCQRDKYILLFDIHAGYARN